jgi:hypothetical protein
VETLQRPEIQEVEEQRGGGGGDDLSLLRWEILVGAGAGGLLAAIILLVAVLCRRRQWRQRQQEQTLLPSGSREEESSLQTDQLESASLGFRAAAAATSAMVTKTMDRPPTASSPDLLPHKNPGSRNCLLFMANAP